MNNNYSETSSINVNHGNNYSATSSIKNGAQLGGNYSATSIASAASTNSVKDINKLLSMLTSESDANEPATQKDALSNTSTQTLENQLRDILKQDGGAKKHRQSGGSNVNVADIKSFFTTLKSQGVKVDLKLNNKSMSEYFNENSTTTDLNNHQDVGIPNLDKNFLVKDIVLLPEFSNNYVYEFLRQCIENIQLVPTHPQQNMTSYFCWLLI